MSEDKVIVQEHSIDMKNVELSERREIQNVDGMRAEIKYFLVNLTKIMKLTFVYSEVALVCMF